MKISVRQVLESAGMKSIAEVDARRGCTSRYRFLVDTFGEDMADAIMRALEVASWDLSRPMSPQ